MANKKRTPEELARRRAVVARYKAKLKADPERYAKHLEQKRLKLQERKNNKNYQKKNAKHARTYRSKNNEKWNSYFREYFKKWLEDDINYFSHSCRTQLGCKLKNNNKYKEAKENGGNCDHIIPVKLLGEFFKQKELLRRDDRKMLAVLKGIANIGINLRFIKKENNNKANNASLDKQLKVAEVIEEKNKIICEGLCEFLKGVA